MNTIIYVAGIISLSLLAIFGVILSYKVGRSLYVSAWMYLCQIRAMRKEGRLKDGRWHLLPMFVWRDAITFMAGMSIVTSRHEWSYAGRTAIDHSDFD